MFAVIDMAMLRQTTRPPDVGADSGGHGWPDLTDGTVADWRDWLTGVWADHLFAQAVAAASPGLARAVSAVCAGQEQRPRRVRKVAVSVLRYRLRATGRSTPFGLFAGVAPARFGPTSAIRIGEAHLAVERVDAVWLSGLVTELERCPELAMRLTVVVNSTATVRDGRLVIGLRQSPMPAVPGEARTDPAEVSVRYTAAVKLVVEATRTPKPLGAVADLLAAAFPDTPAPTVTTMLLHLVEQRILITSLRPPMTATHPLGHVLSALTDARADELPASRSPLTRLRELTAIHHTATGHTSAGRTAAGDTTTEQPRHVDLRVDTDLVLPNSVADEVAHAADVLTRLTPDPFGKPTWVDYHSRFLERYGVGAAVPLLELVSPGIGLGFPAGYRGSLLTPPPQTPTVRDTALLRLAQTAALDRLTEVALDEAAIAELETDSLDRAQLPPHAELAVRIQAPSRAALDRGDFSLVVAGAFRAAGTTAGRFLDLLDPADQARAADAYAALPTVNDGALRAQVSCPPLYAETENVARSLHILDHLLSIGEHHPTTNKAAHAQGRIRAGDADSAGPGERDGRDGVLAPEDLLVVGDARRLYLWSRSQARPVEPMLLSAVEFTNFAHPLLRFVCEVTAARAAACRPFSWGAAGTLPFLPRLTYRRTVLSSARWKLQAADLPGKDASWPDWTAALASWRERLLVPALVDLGDGDRRLRLDLDVPAHLRLLRADLDRDGRATLQEGPTDDADGWIDGHAHEIVVPLASTQPRTWPTIPKHGAQLTPTTAAGGHLPGTGEWLYCKLYGHPDRHSSLLTTHLPELLWTLDEPVQWWFLPYRDPDDHLRLRFRLTDPPSFGHLAAWLGTWVEGLRGHGLIATMQLDTYHPETGRFGHGHAMTAAEAVFAADSAVACAQRAHLTGQDADGSATADPRALTAASLVDLAAAFTGDHDNGAAWLIKHLATSPRADARRAADRAVFDQARCLAEPDEHALRDLYGGDRIAAAWHARRTAVAAYRDALAAPGHAQGPAPDGVLGSLLHLHCLRTHGIDPLLERVCHRLARAAALSQTAVNRSDADRAPVALTPSSSDGRDRLTRTRAALMEAGA